MIGRLRQSEFVRSVSILLSGAIIAQVIGYLLYPVISRLYSEEDMGELGLYTRITAFLAALATARYEVALPIAKREEHAFVLYRLALRITLVVTAILAVISLTGMFLFTHVVFEWWFLLLTLGSVVFLAWINVGSNWSVRKGHYKTISTQRITSSVLMNVSRIGLGWFGWGGKALLSSALLSHLAGALVYIRDFRKTAGSHQKNSKKLRAVAKEYRAFPLINLPQILMELSTDIAIAACVEYYFTQKIFGAYSFALTILKVPLGIAGQSIGQVFFNRCSALYNNGESSRPLLLKTYGLLSLLSIVPFVVLLMAGPEIFRFVFGARWEYAGSMAAILSPMLFFNFLLSPVSTIPMVFGRQKTAFVIAIASVLNQLTCFLIIPTVFHQTDFLEILMLFSITQSVLLVVVGFVYFRMAE